MTKIGNIFEGWKNLVFKTPKIEEIATKRGEICYKCEYVVGNNILGATCGKCGCPIKAKIRSPFDKCPINKW